MAADKPLGPGEIPLFTYDDCFGVLTPEGVAAHVKLRLGIVFVTHENHISVAFTEKVLKDLTEGNASPTASVSQRQHAANARLLIRSLREHLNCMEAVLDGKAEPLTPPKERMDS